MKIVALIGSPRKGDSCKITGMVEEHLKKYKDLEFEYIFLKDYNIDICNGCFMCVRKGKNFCPLKDDVSLIISKIEQADGVIFSSPVYALSIPGLMKNFIDRSAYNAHRPSFFGKKAMVIVTSMGTGVNDTIKFIGSLEIWGIEFVSNLGVITHPTLKPTGHYNKILEKKIGQESDRFYNKVKKTGIRKPSTIKVIQFSVLKYMSCIGKEGFPADYAFYKDKNYYYGTQLGFFQKLLSKLSVFIVSKVMRKNYVTP